MQTAARSNKDKILYTFTPDENILLRNIIIIFPKTYFQ